jgi:hypothetical protein
MLRFHFFLGQSSIREVIEIQRQVTEGIERSIRGRWVGVDLEDSPDENIAETAISAEGERIMLSCLLLYVFV